MRTKHLKIIIDATQQESHVTGTDRLAYNVLKQLQILDTENHYTVMCTRGFDYIPSVITAPNFTVIRTRVFRSYWKLIIAPFRITRLLRRKYIEKPDIFYSFHNMNSPRIKFSPVVSSALDLIPLVFRDQYHKNPGRAKIYRSRVQHTVKVADHFVAISQYTKDDLGQLLDVPPDKVTVMHLAADAKFNENASEADLRKVRKKYRLPKNFILTIGANEPRKNAAGVIEAYRGLPPEIQKKYSLVVLGKAWNNQKLESLDDLPVIFTGFADDDDLPIIYNLADCFVFLSKYEGFGMPVLEAMSCGTPVVTANNTSLPEVAGDAALLVDAEDTDAATRAIYSVLTDSSLASKLVREGRRQAASFNWKSTAQILLDVLRKVGKR